MTRLEIIAEQDLSIDLTTLSGDSELVQEIQERLGKIGFIDISTILLGAFGAETDMALRKFQGVARRSSTSNIDRSFSRKLLEITKTIDLPVAINQDVIISLTQGVGDGGANIAADVLAVKNRLADLGFRVSRSSNIGPVTINAIKLFQSIISGKKNLKAVDGVIDVNGITHKALQKSFAPKWQEMISGSVQAGFLNSDFLAKEDNGDFGTTWMVEAIQAAGLIYHKSHLSINPKAALIAVNDISQENGGVFKPHEEHQVGLCCDIYLPRKDGNSGLTSVTESSKYDQDAMEAMLIAFHSQTKHPIVQILLDDKDLSQKEINGKKLCTRDSGHKDHAHVEIRPSNLSDFLSL
jgi:hypothetical protein